jgi:hypothetical protein
VVRQTDIAQTIDLALDKAKYDECAKKLLSYKSIIAWILKSCTKEFSQYSIAFIMDHCLKGKAEISQRAVHQDQPDREERLDRDFKIAMTEEFESEVGKMCNLSDAIEELAIQRGMEKGMQQGMQQGEELFAKLIQKLFALGRTEDVKRVAEDKEYRRILMEEFSIQKE